MAQAHIGAGEYERLSLEAARRLNDELDEPAMSLVFNLVRASSRVTKSLESTVLRDAELSFASYRVLFSLSAVGAASPNELARLSGVSTASMSSLLKTMTRGGLIDREADPDDGRRTVVRLSEHGERTLRSVFPRVNAREREWAALLSTEEGAILAMLLRRVLARRPIVPEEETG